MELDQALKIVAEALGACKLPLKDAQVVLQAWDVIVSNPMKPDLTVAGEDE